MTNEIAQQVYEGEVVAEPEDDFFPYDLDSYEDHENALVAERQSEDVHRWRQCRIAASAVGRFRRRLISDMAKTAGLSPQTIYDYARAWRDRGEARALSAGEDADPDSEDYGQPETLAPTHHVEVSYAPEEDRPKLRREAEEGGWSAQKIRHEAKELREKKAEREHGRAEAVEAPECPACGAAPDHWQRVPEGVSTPAVRERGARR